MEQEFNFGDKVNYGWQLGNCAGLNTDEVFYYLGKTTRGYYVLENPDTGGVFLTKYIEKVENVA